jgi:hypothetical protein
MEKRGHFSVVTPACQHSHAQNSAVILLSTVATFLHLFLPKILMSILSQTGPAEAQFGCNILFYCALGQSQRHSMTEAPMRIVRERRVREIRTLRAMRRELETEPR